MTKPLILLCTRGVSYIQVLLASSVIAGLAVVGLKMMENQERLAKLTAQKFETTYLINEMKFLLKSPVNCRATFKGFNPVKSGRKINSLKKELRSTTNKSTYFLKYFTYDSSQKIYGQSTLKILEYNLSDKAIDVDVLKGSTNLVVTLQSAEEENSRTIKKSIPLKVKVVDGKIESCSLFGEVSAFSREQRKKLYMGKSFHLGTIKESQALSIEGGITLVPIDSRFRFCDPHQVGSLAFSKQENELFICSPNGDWETVGSLPSTTQKPIKYKLNIGQSTEVDLKTKAHRLCTLTSVKSNERGNCKVSRLEKRSKTIWRVDGDFTSAAGGQYCSVECFN